MSEMDELDRYEDAAEAAADLKKFRDANRQDIEHADQVAVFEWCRMNEAQYPDLELFYAIPNGGHRHISVAKRLKAEGVKSGVLDTHLPVERGGYIGLWIEMKTEDGKVRPSQVWWMERLIEEGHMVKVARSAQEAIDILIEYESLPRSVVQR
jgi:hypothetical protein